jgi:hypothetical protein
MTLDMRVIVGLGAWFAFGWLLVKIFHAAVGHDDDAD